MYTSNELEALSMSFDSQMKRLQDEVMSDLVRRLAINGEITRAADWQINRLYELGESKEKIERFIQRSLKLSDEEMTELYKEALESGYARNEGIYKKVGAEFIPFEENALLQQYIAAVAKQTTEEMHNISQSLGFAVKNADGTLFFKPIAQYYQDTLDNAINGIASGVFDYNTALNKAVKEMTNSGLRTVDYASGWSNRVDVAARRAIMTGMSQLTGKVNEMNAEKLDTDTYEVTWHSGARPSHQVWQGKWYTMDELISVCGLGTVTGLNGANCYHDYYPVIPGISVPTYTAEELEELNRKENTPVKYEGKEYTKYEALQRQRKLETTMRAQRQKIRLLETGEADEDDIIAARCRYRGTSQEYTRFSKAMDLPQQRERVTVDGLGNIGQGKWKKSVDNTSIDVNEIWKPLDHYSSKRVKEKVPKTLDNYRNVDIIEPKKSFVFPKDTSSKINKTDKRKNVDVPNEGSKAFSEEKKKKLYQQERILVGNKYEKAVLYDKEGNIIFQKKGDKSHVSFTKTEIKKMRGGVLTHNHPNNSPLSPADINMLRISKLSEIRACTQNGSYILRQPKKWHNEIIDASQIDKKYWEAMNEAGEKYKEIAAREGKSIIYFLDEMDKEGMKLFSEKYGLDFEWEAKK